MRTRGWSSWTVFSKVKICCKESEGKGTDTKWHVKSSTSSTLASPEPESWEWITRGWFWSLSLRRILANQKWVLYCVNQSEVSNVLSQPIRSKYYLVSTNQKQVFTWGLGGTLSLGSLPSELPLPYRGITLSLLIPALHTGQICLLGLVSSHWNRF